MWPVFENGLATEKVDLLVLGDGYTEAQLPKFHADVRRLIGVLFETEPYRQHGAIFWPTTAPAARLCRRAFCRAASRYGMTTVSPALTAAC